MYGSKALGDLYDLSLVMAISGYKDYSVFKSSWDQHIVPRSVPLILNRLSTRQLLEMQLLAYSMEIVCAQMAWETMFDLPPCRQLQDSKPLYCTSGVPFHATERRGIGAVDAESQRI